jgi:hypothetical protein
MKCSYAFSAAATRGSAGVELLAVGGVDAVDGEVELELLVSIVGVVRPLGALGPGFGDLLLHPATTAATMAAATRATKGDLGTDHLPSGVTPPFCGGDAIVVDLP